MVTWVRGGESPFVVPDRAECRPRHRPRRPSGRRPRHRPDLRRAVLMEAPLRQAQCPTLVCGPSGGGLHAIDEWVELGRLRSFTRALVEVLSGAD